MVTAFPLVGIVFFCLICLAVKAVGANRSAGPPLAGLDPEKAKAIRFTRQYCTDLTGHEAVGDMTVESIASFSVRRNRSVNECEVRFQTDNGGHYNARVDCDTGHLYAFCRTDRGRIEPATTPITQKRAELIAAGCLQTIGFHPGSGDKLWRSEIGVADVPTGTATKPAGKDITDYRTQDYLFRLRHIGSSTTNAFIGINRRDGELDQLWSPGG